MGGGEAEPSSPQSAGLTELMNAASVLYYMVVMVTVGDMACRCDELHKHAGRSSQLLDPTLTSLDSDQGWVERLCGTHPW